MTDLAAEAPGSQGGRGLTRNRRLRSHDEVAGEELGPLVDRDTTDDLDAVPGKEVPRQDRPRGIGQGQCRLNRSTGSHERIVRERRLGSRVHRDGRPLHGVHEAAPNGYRGRARELDRRVHGAVDVDQLDSAARARDA